MGQTLSEAVTTKETFTARNENFVVASSCMQGWRVSMEDAHTVILSMPEDHTCSYFAVFDGHGGASIANHASRNLHRYIVQHPEYQNNIVEALKEAFHDLDEYMKSDRTLQKELAGSTAVIILIKNNVIMCANSGDSRAVAFIDRQMVPLSFDHKPSNPEERERIIEAGAQVTHNRINGNLALSRALGDFTYKKNPNKNWKEQAVTCLPEITSKELEKALQFIALASDGIWDVISSEELCQFIQERIEALIAPDVICEELLNRCLAPDSDMGGIGSDNMTIILIISTSGVSLEYQNLLHSSNISIENKMYFSPESKKTRRRAPSSTDIS